MKRDEQATETLTTRVPGPMREGLRALLNTTAGVTFRELGWRGEFRIVAPPAVMAELKPKIEDMVADYLSRDAW